MWRWDVRWDDAKMWRWEDVKMRRYRRWRWEDVKMWRCEDEDEKMWWQTSTTKTMHPRRNPQCGMHVGRVGVGVGWGDVNVHVHVNTLKSWGWGLGWGGVMLTFMFMWARWSHGNTLRLCTGIYNCSLELIPAASQTTCRFIEEAKLFQLLPALHRIFANVWNLFAELLPWSIWVSSSPFQVTLAHRLFGVRILRSLFLLTWLPILSTWICSAVVSMSGLFWTAILFSNAGFPQLLYFCNHPVCALIFRKPSSDEPWMLFHTSGKKKTRHASDMFEWILSFDVQKNTHRTLQISIDSSFRS